MGAPPHELDVCCEGTFLAPCAYSIAIGAMIKKDTGKQGPCPDNCTECAFFGCQLCAGGWPMLLYGCAVRMDAGQGPLMALCSETLLCPFTCATCAMAKHNADNKPMTSAAFVSL